MLHVLFYHHNHHHHDLLRKCGIILPLVFVCCVHTVKILKANQPTNQSVMKLLITKIFIFDELCFILLDKNALVHHSSMPASRHYNCMKKWINTMNGVIPWAKSKSAHYLTNQYTYAAVL